MARIRSIKPEFWKSEAIARLPIRTRLSFIALWSYVDDNGVGRDVPQLIAGELWALELDPREALANVREDLARLSEEGRIVRYTVEGKPFLSITGWSEHQRIDKPNKARYPQADDPAAVLTCGYGESREDAATVSRQSRECPAPGAVEQGSRGAGEQRIENTPPNRASHTAAVALNGHASDFDAFWMTYPRRTAKTAAKTAYARAIKTATVEEILAGAIRYRDDTSRAAPFTAHPATWLNQGRWDDEGPARPAAENARDAAVRNTLALQRPEWDTT